MELKTLEEDYNFFWEDKGNKLTISNGRYVAVIDKNSCNKLFNVLEREGFADTDNVFVAKMLKERYAAKKNMYNCGICRGWHKMGEHTKIW